MKIKVTRIVGVANWYWDVGDVDSCGICSGQFERACPQCTLPGTGCPITWGECGHLFHAHCIERWLSDGKTTCPFCRQDWKVPNEDNGKSDTVGMISPTEEKTLQT
ncbi:putative Anaphase-promoting complex subunit 11 [Blattamonas nauphoetae]|uniref:Anaphase-promoting complex subunit 11 n=1 Tax=Blattamonas nauphoetae TaxID=2049346 RepID=A0ABQ9Y052_9EUKA|nr:putative Anaphase-promoting complex subunit 11 [Blattamonas nauphoetae]